MGSFLEDVAGDVKGHEKKGFRRPFSRPEFHFAGPGGCLAGIKKRPTVPSREAQTTKGGPPVGWGSGKLIVVPVWDLHGLPGQLVVTVSKELNHPVSHEGMTSAFRHVLIAQKGRGECRFLH